MKTKIITSLALAGALFAGPFNSVAQTNAEAVPPSSGTRPPPTNPPAPPPPASRPDAPVSDTGGTVRPAPAGDATPPGVTGVVPGDRGNIGIVPPSQPVPPAPPAGNGGRPMPRPIPPEPRVVLFTGAPVMTILPAPANAGDVVVMAGDITRVAPPIDAGSGGSPVVLLTRQFAEQRNQELSVRATALEQLRSATPDQRASIIADLQASQARLATEQREAARELRNELRALREERKGK